MDQGQVAICGKQSRVLPHRKDDIRILYKTATRRYLNKFRDIVLGYKHISTLHENDEDSSYRERVGKYISEGYVNRADENSSFVGGTQLKTLNGMMTFCLS